MPSAPSPRDIARRTLSAVQNRAAHGQRVVFIHVPKCGGTSVRVALRGAFTLRGLGAVSLDPVASKQVADWKGEDILDVRERWLLYHLARGRSPLIMGHFPFSPTLIESSGYRVLTLLRDPVAHLLSEFFYNRDKADNSHMGIDRAMTLKDYLATDRAALLGHSYVRYFTDPELRATPQAPEALTAAMANLRRLDVVGTLEHIDAWAARVGEIASRPIQVGRLRATPTSSSKRDSEIDDEALAKAAELTAVNRAVYELVTELSG